MRVREKTLTEKKLIKKKKNHHLTEETAPETVVRHMLQRAWQCVSV